MRVSVPTDYGGSDSLIEQVVLRGYDSIGSRPRGDDGHVTDRSGAYCICVRFDGRTYQTLTQARLDDLRVADSACIERDRVRRC